MKYLVLIAAAGAWVVSAQAQTDPEFTMMDSNGDGYLTQSEFMTAKTASGEMSDADALVQFIAIDSDASGAISPEEMAAATSDTQPADTMPEKSEGGETPDY